MLLFRQFCSKLTNHVPVGFFGILEWQKLQSYETFEIFFDSMLASYYWEMRGGLRSNDFMI